MGARVGRIMAVLLGLGVVSQANAQSTNFYYPQPMAAVEQAQAALNDILSTNVFSGAASWVTNWDWRDIAEFIPPQPGEWPQHPGAVRIHPLYLTMDRVFRSWDIPTNGVPVLHIEFRPWNDTYLAVFVNDQRVWEVAVVGGWQQVNLDLRPWAGQTAQIGLVHTMGGPGSPWSFEHLWLDQVGLLVLPAPPADLLSLAPLPDTQTNGWWQPWTFNNNGTVQVYEPDGLPVSTLMDGKTYVVSTGPPAPDIPYLISRQMDLPDRNALLRLVGRGDDDFVYKLFVDDTLLASNVVGCVGWTTNLFDLTPWGGTNRTVRLEHWAGGRNLWNFEGGHWADLTVAEVLPPVIIQDPAGPRVHASETLELTVRALGQQPLTYQWRFNGRDLAGATNSTLSLPNFQAANEGAYSVLVTNAYGTALSAETLPDLVLGFADPNLEAAIRDALARPVGEVTVGDLHGLDSFSAPERGITNITELRWATHITALNLYGNQIADVASLAGVTNLTWLDLGWNQVTNAQVVAGMTQLTGLSLEGNQFVDISPVAGLVGLTWLSLYSTSLQDLAPLTRMTNLTRLYLGDNQIANVQALAGMTQLVELSLGGNQLVDASPLAGLGWLTLLDLGSNRLRDLEPLAGLTNLVSLYLSGNQVTNAQPLASMKQLTGLNLDGNQLDDVSPLAGLVRLSSLYLYNNRIHDLEPLAGLTNLTSLDLGWNQVTNAQALAGMTLLTGLNLEGNQLVDASPLAHLVGLTSLSLYFNSVHDLGPLAGMTNLTSLDLGWNQATNDQALAGMTQLTTLNLEGNRLVDASALAGLVGLTSLSLYFNSVHDLGPLAGMTNLTSLSLGWNQATNDQALAGMTQLTTLNLEGNRCVDISPLAGLVRLTWLSLYFNSVQDVGPLAGLTNLTELSLGNNLLTNIAPLAGLPRLTHVDVASNYLDVSPGSAALGVIDAWLAREVVVDYGNEGQALPPTTTTPPRDQTSFVGANVSFSVEASGPATLTYQWRKDGVSLAGATLMSYTLARVQFPDAGTYDVVVSNPWGSVTSTPPAVLTVMPLTWEFSGTPGAGIEVGLTDVWSRGPNEAYALGERQRSHRVDIPDAYLYRWDGSSWSPLASFPGHHAGRVFGTGTSELWVILSRCTLGPGAGCGNDQGGKVYWSGDQGASWTEQALPAEIAGQEFRSLGGTSANVQVLVQGGTIVRFDGSAWSTVFRDPVESVNALAFVGPSEGYYVTCWGWGGWSGSAWQFAGRQFDFCEVTATWAIRDSSGALQWYAVGNNNQANGVRVWEFDPGLQSFGGKTNFLFGDGDGAGLGTATAIWGSAADDVYVAGELASVAGGTRSGRVYHFDGAAWSRITTFGEIPPARAVHGTARNDAWVALSDGRLLHLNSGVGVSQAPMITMPPVDQHVVLGDPGRVEVAVRGTPPLSYQWFFNDTNSITGATGPALRLSATQTNDAGSYRVVITNLFGAVTSDPVALDLIVPPDILAQPQGTQLLAGASLDLSVTASGATDYQWRKNGADIIGATNAFFTIPSAQIADGGSYTVVVANDAGAKLSAIAQVIVAQWVVPPGVADMFADRISLVLTGGPSLFTNSASGFSTNATKEPLEPDHAYRLGGRSVWFHWQAPATGIARFDTYGSTFDTLLAIYTGNQVSALTQVAANDDDASNDPNLATNRFFASHVQFNAKVGTDYALAVDGFAGAGGYFVLNGQFEVTTHLLPEIVLQPASQVVRPGDPVTLSVNAQSLGTPLSYQWYQNGVPVGGQQGSFLTRTNVGVVDVGEYSVRVTDAVSGRYADSEKALLEISSDPAQGVLLQDKLDTLSRVGPLPPTGNSKPRPKDLVTTIGDSGNFYYSVGAGTVGLHVGNNVHATTDQGEGNPGNLIGHASLWLYFTTTNAGVLEVDTRGSLIGNLFALYDYGPLVNLDNLANHLLGWVTNGAKASTVNSVRVTNGPAGGEFLVLADAIYQQRGALEINWAFGTLPQQTLTTMTTPVQRLDPGTNFTLGLTNATVTSALPPPTYWWYRDGQLLGQTTVPTYELMDASLNSSGTYSVVASNALGVSTNVLERLLTKVPLRLDPLSQRLSGGLFSLGITGTEGDVVALQMTTNLVSWQALTNLTLGGYEQRFDDANAAASPRRFYRLWLKP